MLFRVYWSVVNNGVETNYFQVCFVLESETEDRWEQHQQKVLEMALQQFPKTESERWEKIAKCVPGKTKVGVVIDLNNELKFFF